MLIRYSVENFLSFNDRTSFSMIAGKGTLKQEHKSDPINGVSVLKSSIILGANASGKSNLVKAMSFGKRMVLRGFPSDEEITYSKFRLDASSAERNSFMEFEIQSNGKNYAYGFVFNNYKVEEEWLYQLTKNRQKLIFERNASRESQFEISPILSLNNKDEEKQFLQFIAKGTPDNRLFLKEIFERKVKENVFNIEPLLDVYEWFLNSLKFIFPDDKYREGIKSELVDNEKLQEFFENMLNYFDTGINGICLKEVDIDTLELPSRIVDKIKSDLSNIKSKEVKSILSTPDNTYIISRGENGIITNKFMTKHRIKGSKDMELFDTKDESDGTNRIIDYIPVILDLIMGGNVFVIDEMERSLHPNIIYDIIDLFLDFSKTKNSQLIISTHESSLITQKLFRKDEIWFVVKDDDGASTLYSLEDYNIRFDKKIRKDYLLGRFKAVPKIGNRQLVSSKFKKQ